MSEGSRGNGSAGRSNGNGSSDDFYATVSTSAGASRSTRIRHGEPGADDQPTNPWTEPTPVGQPSDAASAWARPSADSPQPAPESAKPDQAPESTEPAGATGATGADAKPEPLEAGPDSAEAKPAGKSWRDRWSSLTASVTGKQPKVSATGTPLQTVEESKATEELVNGSGAAARNGVEARNAQPADEAGAKRTANGASGKKQTPYELATARLYGSPETSAPPRPAQPEVLATATIPVAAGVSASATAVKTPEAAAVVAAPDGAAPKPKVGAARRTRKARLRLSRLDPWSVMKTAFLFSIAAGIVMVVAVYVVWTVIGSSGLFASINDIVGSVVSTPGDTTPFRVEEYVNTQKVMGVTAFLACIDVVIFTALATLASFLYNLAATMLGGLEVTLAED